MAEERGSDIDRQFDATLMLQIVVKWAHEIVAESPANMAQFEAWVHQEMPAAKALDAPQILTNARIALKMLTNSVTERYVAIQTAEDIAKGDRE